MAAGIVVGFSRTETDHAAPMELAAQYLLAVVPSSPPARTPSPPSHRRTSKEEFRALMSGFLASLIWT